MLGKRYENDGVPLLRLNALQVDVRERVVQKVDSGHYRFEQVPCCVCGGEDFRQLAGKDRYGLFMPVVICRTCGLVQTNPRMEASAYLEFYKAEYRKLYVGDPVPSSGFFASQYGKGRRIHRYLDSLGLLKGQSGAPRVLEVGCGAGGILKRFAESGCTVAGLDLDDDYLEYGRSNHGLDLSLSTAGDYVPERPADVVIYSHVLEHFPDPLAELEEVRRILDKDGVLYIEVPGIKNLMRSYEMDFLRYLQNAHVYHFTLKTLGNLLEKAGFRLIAGDEGIHSVFKVGAKTGSVAFRSDYEDAVRFLERVERLRGLLPFPPYRLKTLPKDAVEGILKASGLHPFARRLYRRMRGLSPRS